jgi:hypothetical protein
MTGDEEKAVRMLLWLSHGHSGPDLYGDDGEMQCAQCVQVWDYKRAPLLDVVRCALAYAATATVSRREIFREVCKWIAGKDTPFCEYLLQGEDDFIKQGKE